ncbi:single-strand binding protein [Streptomyces sp. TLI_235]|nr:single-stranded DNA-binding protein [Streptomyces sp. TLI_235]PBC71533.1 single-strand binding protein [Streptomyces sp. TLI_235]
MLPTLTGVGRVVADPELNFTQSGKAVARVRLVFQNRRKNDQTGQWEDGDTLWIDGTAWNQLAEHIAETLAQGMEVLVSGEPRTETWDQDGQKRSKVTLQIRSIGPSLAYATAQVRKADRNDNGQQQAGQRQQPQGGQRQQQAQRPQQNRQQPQDDPWASNTGYSGEEPPF